MRDRTHTAPKLGSGVVLVFPALLISACGANLPGSATGSSDGAFGQVTGYHAANFFLPQGYSVAALDGGRFRVTATASSETPLSRIEKIAMARAAEFGAEQGKKFFQATPAVHSVKCGKRQQTVNGQRVAARPTHYAIAAIEVIYTDQVADAALKPTKDTAEALKAEIQSEVVSAEAQTQAATDVSAKCGR